MKPVKINNKWNILLPDHRADRPEWHTPPYWEGKRIDSLHQHLTKQDILYYIGAEEGDIAGLCAKWVDTVVLFEPNEKVWTNIKAIWEANDLKTPWIVKGFASDIDHKDKSWLQHGFDHISGEIVHDHGFKELRDPADIPQVKIDTLDEMFTFDPGISCTAIALDVEGSEGKVLRGAEKTLKEKRPKLWLSLHPEFLYDQYGEWGYELRNWIKDIGYKEHLLDYQHEVHLFYEFN